VDQHSVTYTWGASSARELHADLDGIWRICQKFESR
jgi:hypothetical protein